MSDFEELEFRGQNSDLFISAIRKRAFAEQKYNDNAWTAEFASTCMIGEALRWFEELDDDVQGDWSKLRRAILARFPPDRPSDMVYSDTSVASSSGSSAIPSLSFASLVPSPAAAPPSNAPETPRRTLPSPPPPPPPPQIASPPTRLGRIRILSPQNLTLGYVTGRESGEGNFTYCTTKIEHALVVSFAPSYERHRIQVMNSEDEGDFNLAVRWPGLNFMNWTTSVKNVAELAAVSQPPPNSFDACQDQIWNVLPDGTVAANYSAHDGVTHTLVPVLELDNFSLRLVRDPDGYLKKKSRLLSFGKDRYTKCRFTFEDL